MTVKTPGHWLTFQAIVHFFAFFQNQNVLVFFTKP
jgi:hypothetical protein